MNIKFLFEQEKLFVYLDGEIDHHNAMGISQTIDFKLRRQNPSEVIMDFSGVSFMDSSGLAVVLGRKKLCDSLECRFLLVGVNEYVSKIFVLSGMDKLINIRR